MREAMITGFDWLEIKMIKVNIKMDSSGFNDRLCEPDEWW